MTSHGSSYGKILPTVSYVSPGVTNWLPVSGGNITVSTINGVSPSGGWNGNATSPLNMNLNNIVAVNNILGDTPYIRGDNGVIVYVENSIPIGAETVLVAGEASIRAYNGDAYHDCKLFLVPLKAQLFVKNGSEQATISVLPTTITLDSITGVEIKNTTTGATGLLQVDGNDLLWNGNKVQTIQT